MNLLPEPLQDLVAALAKLPGIGPRSAERIALHIVQADSEFAQGLARAVLSARDKIRSCQECGTLTDRQPCTICTDPRRDPALLCVVEQPTDVFLLEKSGTFHGKYHVLGGKLSPLNGVEPEDLQIAGLQSRVAAGAIREVILALGADVEGDATAYYLAKQLASANARVTRLAHGLPAGSGLEFADELTLSRALEGRRELQL